MMGTAALEALRAPPIHRLRAGVLPRWITLAGYGGAAGFFGLALFFRFWQLNTVGYNSDEAVYAGQARALAHDQTVLQFFPVFRAHPLLFQTILSIGYRLGGGDLMGRSFAAAFGIGTVILVYLTGRLLYGRRAGLIAALVIALMPYDVLVSRQVLLDGPATFFATASLYLVARYATTLQRPWLYAAGGAMGLTILSKETSVLAIGALFVFFALSPEVQTRTRDLGFAFVAMCAVGIAYPLAIHLAGGGHRGQNYLVWQLFRRPNHVWSFYPATVPLVIGPLVVACALLGLFLLRRQMSWRETLLLSWILVPAAFFQLWPVKGFQYLLVTAPPIALLAGRMLALWRPPPLTLRGRRIPHEAVPIALTALVLVSLGVETWSRITPSRNGVFIAGSGGLLGGRKTGMWVRSHTPLGSEFLAIGPSMSNVISFYGYRKAYGVSVGPNPLRRNPAYEPIGNADLALRRNEIQYLVWDAYSASRSPFFAKKLLDEKTKYNGRLVYSVTLRVPTKSGASASHAVIQVYEVRS
jgi:4-amino-4-deoxy-L-arabinose transferase-like glycosyltransferase